MEARLEIFEDLHAPKAANLLVWLGFHFIEEMSGSPWQFSSLEFLGFSFLAPGLSSSVSGHYSHSLSSGGGF